MPGSISKRVKQISSWAYNAESHDCTQERRKYKEPVLYDVA